jgi:two-component system, NtrC family, sensor histidine kinase PilS
VDTADAPYWRSLRYLGLARLIVAALLVVYLPLLQFGSGAPGPFDRRLFLTVALVYLAVAAVFAWMPLMRRLRFEPLVVVQVLADCVALTLLMHAAGGVQSGFGMLLFLPTAGAAIVSGPRLGLSFAAIAALAVLGETAWRTLGAQPGPDLQQAGLLGAALFATVLLVNRLARRLAAQERLAAQRAEDLRSQLAITQGVISELPDGVVVLGAGGELRAINRAAQDLLGGGVGAGGGAAPGAAGTLPPGLDTLRAALAEAGRPGTHGATPAQDGIEFSVPVPGSGERRRLRARRVATVSPAAGASVVMIEDLGRLEQRAQQLKLAAMGRLSASIAHEIRNPLGAIRHANGLLAERLDGDAGLDRLAAIVEANCVRIDRVIEDVLAIARRSPASPEPLPARAWIQALVTDYLVQSGADPRRLRFAVASDLPIWFDAGQLRQVMVNLLDNALRHATGEPGAVAIDWSEPSAGRAALRVADDGPGIAVGAREHLFEPFFTTESRGTGLGLYLARELCSANGAGIRYEPAGDNPAHRGGFVIEPRQPDPR